jgi:hypothetical protein
MSEAAENTHSYFAEAKILEGALQMPLRHTIQPQGRLQLPAEGGYRSVHLHDYRVKGVMGYEAAYSQVSGMRGVKPGQGWSTLSTTVVEGLNILEVLTADRVVGQIVTEHPLEGSVPMIGFLGTRFENLRIAGHRVDLDVDLDILGEKPEDDASYAREPGVLGRISNQYERILASHHLPAELDERYNRLSSSLGNPERIECSLVNQVAGAFPGRTFGHVLHVRHFGTITLGKLSVTHAQLSEETEIPQKTLVQLTMIDLQLGCVIAGSGTIGSGSVGGGR